jgi:hypothetical protein
LCAAAGNNADIVRSMIQAGEISSTAAGNGGGLKSMAVAPRTTVCGLSAVGVMLEFWMAGSFNDAASSLAARMAYCYGNGITPYVITPRVRKALRSVDQKKPFAEYNVGVLKRADALNAAIVAMVAKGYYGDLNDFIDAEIWAELEKLRSELSHVAGRDAFGAYANTKSSSKLRIERYARPKLPATISHVVTVGSG